METEILKVQKFVSKLKGNKKCRSKRWKLKPETEICFGEEKNVWKKFEKGGEEKREKDTEGKGGTGIEGLRIRELEKDKHRKRLRKTKT